MRRRVLTALLLGWAALGAASGCEWLYDDLDFDQAPALLFRADALTPAPEPADPVALRVMAWNVKYGAARLPFWFDCWGDRVAMTRGEVDGNLGALNALLREVEPDVLLTEEIEVNSRRSAYVNQVEALLNGTTLNYAAYFRTWDSRYIPSEGLGRMDLGMAILSRYPILEAVAIRQPDRTDQDPVTGAFYIHRVIGRAVIAPRPDLRVAIYVVHTEAYDQDGTKQAQLRQIKEVVDGEELPFVLGGDFNELPPSALQLEGFPDERTEAVCSEDFVQPPYTPEAMRPFFDELVPWLPLDAFGTTAEAQRRYFTHSVLGPDEVNEVGQPGDWNRTLDYLFASPGTAWTPGESDVLQRAGQVWRGAPLQSDPLRLSDHAPVIGTWEVTR